MNLQDCKINIENTSFANRLRLRQVLLDNNQVLYNGNQSSLLSKVIDDGSTSYVFHHDGTWCTSIYRHNIILEDFIKKFKKRDQVRNLAFFKQNGRRWTLEELNNIRAFVGSSGTSTEPPKGKFVFDDGSPKYFQYDWVLRDIDGQLEVAYEDVFDETYRKPMESYDLNELYAYLGVRCKI